MSCPVCQLCYSIKSLVRNPILSVINRLGLILEVNVQDKDFFISVRISMKFFHKFPYHKEKGWADHGGYGPNR